MFTRKYLLSELLRGYTDKFFARGLDNEAIRKHEQIARADGFINGIRRIYIHIYGEKSYKRARKHIKYIARKEANFYLT